MTKLNNKPLHPYLNSIVVFGTSGQSGNCLQTVAGSNSIISIYFATEANANNLANL